MALIAGLFSKSWAPIILGLIAGLGLLIGATVIYQKGKTAEKAAQAQAVQAAQKKADALSAQLVAAQAANQAKLDALANTIRGRIASVPVTTACAQSPAIAAAISGVMQLLGSSGPQAR